MIQRKYKGLLKTIRKGMARPWSARAIPFCVLFPRPLYFRWIVKYPLSSQSLATQIPMDFHLPGFDLIGYFRTKNKSDLAGVLNSETGRVEGKLVERSEAVTLKILRPRHAR